MSRVVESIAPARLGRSFRWLLASSWVSNIGDGIGLAAGPLLVASQTNDPLLVALAALLQRLPWLLFGLHAGVIADRLERRRIVVVVDTMRASVLVAVSVMIASDTISVAVVLASMFIIGTAEVFADTTTQTLLPMVVEPADLGLGNSRLMLGFITANQLAGPPIGAALFAIGMGWPFVTHGILVAFGALLISRMAASKPDVPETRAPARRQIADGLRWLWGHPPMRTLTLTIVTFNVTFGAAWSVLVLYATETLDMGEIGFGLLTTASAIGGVLGSWSYTWVEQRISLANIMRGGLIIETLTHLSLAITRTPAVAMVVFFMFGMHAAIWATTSTAVRQRAVPGEFQGRVGSVYMMGVHGGLVVGSAIGGVIAHQWGVTAPFWFAFVGSALILVAIWQALGHIAHRDAESLQHH